MSTALTHAIKFVGDMDEAVRFHIAHLGLSLRFQSPEWQGVPPVAAPEDLHGQRIAKLRDPDGAEFSVSGP